MDSQSSEDSPFSSSVIDSSSSSSTEAVLCAVIGKNSSIGSTLSLGIAIFDPRKSSLQLAEISSDEHLTALESILIQVGAASVIYPHGEATSWQRRLPHCVHAVGAELIEAKKNIFTQDNLLQDLSFLLPPSAIKPALARELRLDVASTALAALISYWSLASDESLYHACSIGPYPVASFLNIDAAAAAALHLLPPPQQQQQVLQRILPCNSKYGEAHAAAHDKISAAAAAAAAAATSGGGGVGSIYGLFSRYCCTPLGMRRLHIIITQPLVDAEEISKRHDIVEAFMQEVFRREVFQKHFQHVCDLDRIATRLHRIHAATQANKGGKKAHKMGIGLQDLVKLYDCIAECSSLLKTLHAYNGVGAATVHDELYNKLNKQIKNFNGFIRLIEHSIDMEEAKKNIFIIHHRFDQRMHAAQEKKQEIINKIEEERYNTEMSIHPNYNHKKDNYNYNYNSSSSSSSSSSVKLIQDNNFVFAFRVVKKDHQAVLSRRDKYQQIRLNKNELIFTNTRLKYLANKYKEITHEYNLIQEALVEKCIQVASTYWPVVDGLSDIISLMDVLGSFAAAAAAAPTPYIRPTIQPDGDKIIIKGSRHILLELQEDTTGNNNNNNNNNINNNNNNNNNINININKKINIISNDCIMDGSRGSCINIITGPNMGGKSTYIRQIGIIILIGQIGSFVPCCININKCIFPLFSSIYTRIGYTDVQLKGISTFLKEMIETTAIINSLGGGEGGEKGGKTKKSLIIVDEIGRGTSTYEGFGIAWAVARELSQRNGCFTLFATHFLDLYKLEEEEKKKEKKKKRIYIK